MIKFNLLKTLAVTIALSIAIPSIAVASSLFNLMVSETGLQRITYAELAEQGADLVGVKHRRLALTKNGVPVPIFTRGQTSNDKRARQFFGAGGYIEFYAKVDDSLYSSETAYTLQLSRRLRRHIPIVQSPRFNRRSAVHASYIQTTTIEDNAYYDFLAPSTTDPWHFGLFIGAGGKTGTDIGFELNDVSVGAVSMDVQVYGLVDIPGEGNDHHVALFLNGKGVGDLQFNGNVSADLSLPSSDQEISLNEGSNTFRMDLVGIEGMPFDAVGLNKFSFHYPRLPVASNNYLSGRMSQGQYQVTGFDSRAIRVYKLAENGSVSRLKNVRRTRRADVNGYYQARFVVDDADAQMIVVADGGYKKLQLELINDEQNIREGDAEYLIISHNSFIGERLQSFAEVRSQQSQLSVKIVDVAQIYGQFGAHVPSADAIKNYIAFAVDHLHTKYVLLVGGDQYDYKHYQSNAVSHIPTLYASTKGGALQVRQNPVDSLYGDIDGDMVPDIPVGRFPVRTLQELDYVVEKIFDYQARESYAGLAVVAADIDDNGNSISFVDDANNTIQLMPDQWQDGLVRAFPQLDGAQPAKDKLFNAIAGGVSLATYLGHSATQQWSKATPPLMQASEVPLLNNIDKPTVITQWGCWNTYFVKPDSNSLSQAFLLNGYNGAATVLGASSLTSLSAERVMSNALMPRLLTKGTRIGDAVIAAKKELFAQIPTANDVLLGWQILGDPALVVNP